MRLRKRWLLGLFGAMLCHASLVQAGPSAGDIPQRDVGEGPFARLVIRNVDIIDGTGAPIQGPYDVVIEKDRVTEIRSIGAPGGIDASKRVAAGDREIDGSGFTLLPGFVDTHVHLHGDNDSQGVPPEYILKLWLAHGVTTARELGSGKPIEWMADVKRRSEANEIVAPRLDIYPFFNAIQPGINTPALARDAVRNARKRGADGIKFIGAIPEDVLFAALDEAEKIGMRTTMHHSQQMVAYANVLKTAAHGLDSMEHWYGLPEAMFTDRRLQQWPVAFNNTDEQWRFSEAGRLWQQAAEPGSERWNVVMDELLERDFALSPTFVAYLASRDLMRMTNASWHDAYTLPALWDFYRPSRHHHGSYWFDWTLEHEVDWRNNYRLWMRFVNEYKNRGGLVGVGSDSGYIYNLYGFGYVQEMELLREAGFSSLEVLHAATGVGAKILGHEDRAGNVRVGRKADLVLVRGNPVANLKLLYGTGTILLDDKTDRVHRVGGVDFTIKDGIVYDAAKLREDVRRMVSQAKAAAGLPDAPMKVEHDD
ncbi:amidohydrolase family protein [Stenotrophomonas humi]|uniref:amidohydrolase family protein n=1 Tax=Stenotrophomonas humi TaxID=405444 RepID=UPI00070C711D|nr:amidohydrolase family protein [Stenotrophomonas humi]